MAGDTHLLLFGIGFTSSYPSISSSLLKTVLPSLVSVNPITVAFVSLAHYIYLSQNDIYIQMNEVHASCLKYVSCVIDNLRQRIKLIIHPLSRKTTAVEREKFPQHIISFWASWPRVQIDVTQQLQDKPEVCPILVQMNF